jgi:hypothetical protein
MAWHSNTLRMRRWNGASGVTHEQALRLLRPSTATEDRILQAFSDVTGSRSSCGRWRAGSDVGRAMDANRVARVVASPITARTT